MHPLILVGVIVHLFGTSFYLKDTLKGKSKPNRVSFLGWAIAPLIGTFIAFSEGVTWAVVPVFMAGFGPLIIFFASFVNPDAYWKLTKFDYICGLFSLVALVIWLSTRQAELAIIFAIASDGFAAFPTVMKSFKFPETETGISYVTSLLSSLTSFSAITAWSFTESAFPIYLVAMSSIFVFALFKKKLVSLIS